MKKHGIFTIKELRLECRVYNNKVFRGFKEDNQLMQDVFLNQREADYLLSIEKHCNNDTPYQFTGFQDNLVIPLESVDKRENFLLDLWSSGRITLKGTYQNRARSTFVLARIDFNGKPHRNPDDVEVPCPHIHIYREGFGNRFAYPLPEDYFSNPDDLNITLQEFFKYCNITKQRNIVTGLLL